MTDQTTVGAVARIPLFAGLTGEEQGRVASACRSVRFNTGEAVVNEGEFAFDVYAIVHGAADVVQDAERIAGLKAGDVFGESGVIPAAGRHWTRRRNASVMATEPTEAIVIEGSAFRRLTDEITALRDALDAMAARRSTQR